jgi:hypothetical protein
MIGAIHSIFSEETRPLLTEEEAWHLIPLLLSITRKTQQEIISKKAQSEWKKGHPEIVKQLEKEINNVIERWSHKMSRLGLKPVAMWKVTVPTTTGDVMWEFPKDTFSIETSPEAPLH